MKTIIGIDPDVDKSGCAMVDVAKRTIHLASLRFPELLAFLESRQDADLLVAIEGGWLNHSNWHVGYYNSPQRAAEIGRATGRNHQVGILLAEWCEFKKIHYVIVKPLRKCWKGKEGKITHAELARLVPIKGARSNQEERDAALIAWSTARLPWLK